MMHQFPTFIPEDASIYDEQSIKRNANFTTHPIILNGATITTYQML